MSVFCGPRNDSCIYTEIPNYWYKSCINNKNTIAGCLNHKENARLLSKKRSPDRCLHFKLSWILVTALKIFFYRKTVETLSKDVSVFEYCNWLENYPWKTNPAAFEFITEEFVDGSMSTFSITTIRILDRFQIIR